MNFHCCRWNINRSDRCFVFHLYTYVSKFTTDLRGFKSQDRLDVVLTTIKCSRIWTYGWRGPRPRQFALFAWRRCFSFADAALTTWRHIHSVFQNCLYVFMTFRLDVFMGPTWGWYPFHLSDLPSVPKHVVCWKTYSQDRSRATLGGSDF